MADIAILVTTMFKLFVFHLRRVTSGGSQVRMALPLKIWKGSGNLRDCLSHTVKDTNLSDEPGVMK